MTQRIAVVTGARSYTGSAVAAALLARGWAVRTLTNRSDPIHDPGPMQVHPLQFTDEAALVDALRGASVFVNTYWVRYPQAGHSFAEAVRRSGWLFDGARAAGVDRLVHVSVSNPSADSPLDYYRGKAEVEDLVRDSGLPFSIVRPTLVVGGRDILINNIAWFLRRLPLFAMPGRGDYRVQPILLDELGALVADACEHVGDEVFDAAGPEVMSFEALVRDIAAAVDRPARIVHFPTWLSLALIRMVGWFKGEVILARQELDGLAQELLVSSDPPRGRASVRDWLHDHGAELGVSYASELARHARSPAARPATA
jgi:uncharacterized protein YbjT (DUF2867 family)